MKKRSTNQLRHVPKTRFFIVTVFLFLIGSPLLFSCGGGGGGGGGGDAETFEMAAFFPLSSGWETDNWTLLVDAADYDINGVATKAMADTRDPGVLFWTNDENGWMLHGVLDEDGLMVVFEPPILFTHSTCRIGDKSEGEFEVEGEVIKFSLELVGVENVTVPAGTFNNCLKFVLHLWPASELSSQYGYETFWLAKNVGFVKGMADADSGSELFTDGGETRQLLSYHITPANMSAEEQEVRAAHEQINAYFRNGDMQAVADMISEDYFDRRCRDKATVVNSWTDYMNSVSNYVEVVTIEDVTVNGDNAYVFREFFSMHTWDATGLMGWDWSRELRRWRKESGEWKYYGVHLGFSNDWLDVWVRNTAEAGEYNPFEVVLNDCQTQAPIESADVIASLTVTGPPQSGINNLDLMPSWVPDYRGFWDPDSLNNAVSGFYTFRVENQNGDYYMLTDYLEAKPTLELPAIVSPEDGAVDVVPANVVLDWDPVARAEGYRVDLRFWDGDAWVYMPNIYTGITQHTLSLSPGTRYRWRVRARIYDVFGNLDNESRSDWHHFDTSSI